MHPGSHTGSKCRRTKHPLFRAQRAPTTYHAYGNSVGQPSQITRYRLGSQIWPAESAVLKRLVSLSEHESCQERQQMIRALTVTQQVLMSVMLILHVAIHNQEQVAISGRLAEIIDG